MRSAVILAALASSIAFASAELNLTTPSTRDLNAPADDMDMIYS